MTMWEKLYSSNIQYDLLVLPYYKFFFQRIMIDLKYIYPSISSDEIVDLVLETKPWFMKVLEYVPKPITNQSTPKRMTE